MSEAPRDPGLHGRGGSDGQGVNLAPEAFSRQGILMPSNPMPHRGHKAPTRCEHGVSMRCTRNEQWPNREQQTPRGGRKTVAVPGRGDKAGSEGMRCRVCPGEGSGGARAEGAGRALQAEGTACTEAQRWRAG